MTALQFLHGFSYIESYNADYGLGNTQAWRGLRGRGVAFSLFVLIQKRTLSGTKEYMRRLLKL